MLNRFSALCLHSIAHCVLSPVLCLAQDAPAKPGLPVVIRFEVELIVVDDSECTGLLELSQDSLDAKPALDRAKELIAKGKAIQLASRKVSSTLTENAAKPAQVFPSASISLPTQKKGAYRKRSIGLELEIVPVMVPENPGVMDLAIKVTRSEFLPAAKAKGKLQQSIATSSIPPVSGININTALTTHSGITTLVGMVRPGPTTSGELSPGRCFLFITPFAQTN
jgi:hypothetical protein